MTALTSSSNSGSFELSSKTNSSNHGQNEYGINRGDS